jgi:hypothetical protein
LVPRLQWEVLIPDRVPAYITWERYLANQRRLEANRSRPDTQGAPRHGPSLLAGLIHCARCGHRMYVAYPARGGPAHYLCVRDSIDNAGPRCQSLAGRPLEELIAALVVQAVEPAAVELSLAAVSDLQSERQRLHEIWKQRLERARYQTRHAERQYQAVDPDNRLVAHELERRWEQALLEQHQLEEKCDHFLAEQPLELSDAERQELVRLAADLPAVWNSPSTTAQDRQEIVRILIRRVEVACQDRTEWVDVAVHWEGGVVTRHVVRRPVIGYEQLSNYESLRSRVLELRQLGHTSKQIAATLSREGYYPPRGGDWFTHHMIIELLKRLGLHGASPGPRLDAAAIGPNEWGLKALAERLGMSVNTLHYWCRHGWVRSRKLPGPKGCRILWADAQELKRLTCLLAYQPHGHPPAYPSELTTPRTPLDIQEPSLAKSGTRNHKPTPRGDRRTVNVRPHRECSRRNHRPS